MALSAALRKGDASVLNIYTVDFTASNILGFAFFPGSFVNFPNLCSGAEQYNIGP